MRADKIKEIEENIKLISGVYVTLKNNVCCIPRGIELSNLKNWIKSNFLLE